MIRIVRSLACLASLAFAALGQSPSTPVPKPAAAFQVADIHASPYSFQSNYFHRNLQGADRYLFHQALSLIHI